MAKYLIKETLDDGIRGKLDFDMLFYGYYGEMWRISMSIVGWSRWSYSGDDRWSEESGALRDHGM